MTPAAASSAVRFELVANHCADGYRVGATGAKRETSS
jgi:hypothetical protein